MGHETTELSIDRYGRLQQIPHWKTWFPTSSRHRWIHLQSPQRQNTLFHHHLEMLEEPKQEVPLPFEHIESAFEALSMHIAGTFELLAIVN